MKRPNGIIVALVLPALMLVSCSTRAAKTKVPELTTVPAVAVEALCTRLHGEGVASGSSIAVLSMSQPLISGASLRSLAHAYYKDGELTGVAAVINAALRPVKVEVLGSRSCNWSPVDRLDPVQLAQTPVVEFSAPFPNPFARGESGVLVRMTIAGQDGQWYWVPLAEHNGLLGVGMVMPMDMPSS